MKSNSQHRFGGGGVLIGTSKPHLTIPLFYGHRKKSDASGGFFHYHNFEKLFPSQRMMMTGRAGDKISFIETHIPTTSYSL
jgi:hypothetical protein